LKVAHVVRSDSFAGVERYISLVAPRLAARGCEVTVIGGDQSRMGQQSDAVRWLPATTTLAAATKLAHLGRLDVVHAHMTAGETAALVAKPRNRAHLVATLHFASRRGSGTSGVIHRILERALDEQIAISDFVASRVHATRVLPNGVAIADPGPSIRQRRVLVMQRLEVEKQTDVVLRAWSLSRLRGEGWRLEIAGRGSQLSKLRRLTIDLELADTVDWIGFVDDPSTLLSEAGVFLAPAPAEPFGLTVVEAMARATPVIAADGGAHRETVGANGWLFPPGDSAACARLLDSARHCDLASYGASLRTRQHELFDIDAHTDRLLRIYRGMTG
jgi:glycosyltransferase involved in cell wall biosynthesis